MARTAKWLGAPGDEYLKPIRNYDENKPHLAIIEIPESFRECEDASNPYFNIKAKRLKNYCAWYVQNGAYQTLNTWRTDELRKGLLSVNGVGPETADEFYDHISDCLARDDFRPRQLFDRFGIEALSTTESAIDSLKWHKQINASHWQGRVITAYRPDNVIDPDFEGFADKVAVLGEMTGEDTSTWNGYLAAHRNRRAFFKDLGATSTDHGHPTARTENLAQVDAAALFSKALAGNCTADEADAFRGHMLTEMARMSLDDGLVMQIHPGSLRNHSATMMARFGRDKGFDIPSRTDFVHALRPLLDAVGTDPRLTIILFMLDEATLSRELAPLAGVYPALRLGPPWWFFDSPAGMMRFRQLTTETAGFYNTVGFNDDTRAFCSIPSRHDMARRVDCAYLAQLVRSGQLTAEEAYELAQDLAYRLAKRAYRL